MQKCAILIRRHHPQIQLQILIFQTSLGNWIGFEKLGFPKMRGKNLTKANPRELERTVGLKNQEIRKIDGLNNRDSISCMTTISSRKTEHCSFTSPRPSSIRSRINIPTLWRAARGVSIVNTAVQSTPKPNKYFPPRRAPSQPPGNCVII